jgi:hypothetical protein
MKAYKDELFDSYEDEGSIDCPEQQSSSSDTLMATAR